MIHYRLIIIKMPTSIGHTFAGIFLKETKIFSPANTALKSLLVSVILANLADIDFLPGLFLGNPNRFHHGVTHSLGATLVTGLVFGFYFYAKRNQFWTPFVFSGLLYLSHVVLDFLTVDTSPPQGVPIFWPLSAKYYLSPISVFSSVHKDSSSATFFQSLFVSENVWTVFREIFILGPFVLLVYLTKFVKKKIQPV